MSERRALTALLAGVVLAAPVRAQEVEQLRRDEARLLARREQLFAQADREARGRFEAEARAVVSLGPLRLAYPAWAPVATDASLLRSIEAQVRRYGAAADTLLTDTLLIWVDTHEPGSSWHVNYRIGRESGTREMTIDSAGSGSWVGEVAVAALEHWSSGLLDPPLWSWAGPLDQRATVAGLRDPLVRDLVSSPSSKARRCLGGATAECRSLLELDAGPTPLLAAYDSTDLPGVFARMELDPRLPGRAGCIGERDASACADMIRRGRAAPPRPVSMRTRQSLLLYAMAAGGEQAWLRLHRAQGRPLAEQLGAAAGMPLDSVVVLWQHDLIAGRRTTTAGLRPSLVLALAWSLIAGLLFAWRYRWRHV